MYSLPQNANVTAAALYAGLRCAVCIIVTVMLVCYFQPVDFEWLFAPCC